MIKNKSGQVTIFIILAILVIAGIVIYLIVREDISKINIPANMQPVYTSFLSCVEEQTLLGVKLLESQAGYIDLPEFEPGSGYMPFSSQLDFLGNPIPYWYYVSGNNIQKEQIPSESEMEKDLANFIDSRISLCNFDSYYEQGFEISIGESKTKIDIQDNKIVLDMDLSLSFSFGNDSVSVSNHNVEVKSELYSLYNSALKVYEKEQTELFLENYGVDTMRLYAPVDGVLLSCSPQVWNAEEVFEDLKNAIEVNTLMLSNQEPEDKENKYFFVDPEIEAGLRFINSQDWANSFEVLPSEGIALVASPVGNQAGLGILGFCYVPYHFVYNINYPVLVQVYEGDEIFQFPLAIVIRGNRPRQSFDTTAILSEESLCKYANTLTTVNLYDYNLDSVEANVSYECLGTNCYLGETSSGRLRTDFPQCVNGYIVVNAEGFEETKYMYSTVSEGEVNIILNRLYELNLDLILGNSNYEGNALISFVSNDNSVTISYPQQKTINLSEGDYSVSVYVYKNSSIVFQETTSKQCIDVASTSLGGFLGLSEEKCFDITIPEQVISSVLIGGGKSDPSFFENSLKNSDTLEIIIPEFDTTKSVADVQENYLLFETSEVEVNLI
jgi:hypothetical protein